MIDHAMKALFSPKAALAAALVLGIVFRVVELGERPMHPAESMRATLSFQWLENPDTSFYKFTPENQGPLLYEVTHVLFALFGVGTGEARLFSLLFGLLVVMTPLCFAPWLGARERWLACGALALSPLFVYYSRFLGHDLAAVCLAAVTAACLLRAVGAVERSDLAAVRRWTLGTAVAAAFLVATSAVAFLYALTLATFALVAWGEKRFSLKGLRAWRADVPPEAAARLAFLALAVFGTTFAVLATSLFKHPDGFLDALYRKVLPYWWQQRGAQAMPLAYPLRIVLLHDFWIALAALGAAVALGARSKRDGLWLLGVLALAVATVPVAWDVRARLPFAVPLLTALKIKDSIDLFVYALVLAVGLRATLTALRNGRRFEALLIHSASFSIVLYGWLGQKAPWLSVHVLYPSVLLAAHVVPRAVTWGIGRLAARPGPWAARSAVAALVVLGLFQARLAWFVSVPTGGSAGNILADEHLSEDVRDLARWMTRVAIQTGDRAEGLPLAFLGAPSWPFFFYLIEGGFKRFVFETAQLTGKERFVVADEDAAKNVRAALTSQGFRELRLTLSGSWGPEHASWSEWLRYAFTRKPASSPERTPMIVFHKP